MLALHGFSFGLALVVLAAFLCRHSTELNINTCPSTSGPSLMTKAACCEGFHPEEVIASALKDALQRMANLKSLAFEVSDSVSDAAAGTLFAPAFSHAPPLQTLRLRIHSISGQHASVLGAALAATQGSSLRVLDLRSNFLFSADMASLLGALLTLPGAFSGLQELHLGQNEVGHHEGVGSRLAGVEGVVRMLQRAHSSLRVLDVSGAVFGEEHMRLLNAALAGLPHVQVLNVTNNHAARIRNATALPVAESATAADAALQLMASTIASLTQVTKLGFAAMLSSNNSSLDEGLCCTLMPRVFSALHGLTALQQLDFSGYTLRAGHLPALADAIRPLTALTQLSLGKPCSAADSAGIGVRRFVRYWQQVIEALACLKCLQNLAVSLPRGVGLEQVSVCMCGMPKLRMLELSRSGVLHSNAHGFGAAIAPLKAVTLLDLSADGINADDMRMLAPHLLQMPSLRQVLLYSNQVKPNMLAGLSGACNELSCKVVGTVGADMNNPDFSE